MRRMRIVGEGPLSSPPLPAAARSPPACRRPLCTTRSEPLPPDHHPALQIPDLDVAVIGGGPGGLAADERIARSETRAVAAVIARLEF